MKKLLGILLLAGTIAFSGCGDDRDDFVVINNNNQVVAAPICADDAYAVSQNAVLTVNAANGVLTNDTPNGATVTFQGTSANGGTVVGAQDGSFTYTPAANFNGADTFTYTLGNSGGVVTCTVTITVNTVNGFFVDATNGSDATGNFNGGLPFQTVQAAVAAAPAGSDIVVRPGNYTGTVNLLNNQRLLGNGSGLAVNPQGAVRPVFTGPIVLADGNTVDFIRVAGTNGDAVDAEGQNGGTITNSEFANTSAGANGGDGIDCRDTRGDWTIANNTFTSLNGAALGATSTGTNVVSHTVRDNTMTGNGLSAVIMTSNNTSDFRAFITGNTFSGNNTVTGNALELQCLGDSTFCLDLEDNTNDDTYVLFDGTLGASVLRIEQFAGNGLTTAQPAGAGNTGTVDAGLGDTPVSVADGFCSTP